MFPLWSCVGKNKIHVEGYSIYYILLFKKEPHVNYKRRKRKLRHEADINKSVEIVYIYPQYIIFYPPLSIMVIKSAKPLSSTLKR